MAGRVKPEGEQRRDLTRSRKTMKFLLDGYFQWTAFDTASMAFKGAGGGNLCRPRRELCGKHTILFKRQQQGRKGVAF